MPTFPIEIAALLERVGDPAAALNAGKLYTKDDGGVTQLFYLADDGTVYQLTPNSSPAQVDTTYYVSSTGNDTNDGLTALTPFLTLGKADSMIPLSVEAVYEVVVLDDTAPFEFTGTQIRTFANGGMIYYRADVDSTLLGATALTAATPSLLTDGLAAWGPDAFAGKWVEILDGTVAGEIRQIRNNDATSLVPVVPFSVGLAAGDSFRIFKPSTVIQETLGNNITVLNGSSSPVSPSHITGLFFERFEITSDLRIGNKVNFFICALFSNIGFRLSADVLTNVNQLNAGTEARAAGLIHGLSNTTYYGAGVLLTKPGAQVATSFSGFFCAIGNVITVFGGHGYLRGGRFSAGIVFDGVFNAVNAVSVADSSGTPNLLAKLTAIRGAVVECERTTITAAAGNALAINTAARVVLGNTCPITATLATAVVIESDGLLIMLNPNVISAGGGAAGFGILARYGGKARLSGLPTVTGGTPGVNDFAVGNVPTLGASALFAAAGVALLPAVVLDGSVVQRVA